MNEQNPDPNQKSKPLPNQQKPPVPQPVQAPTVDVARVAAIEQELKDLRQDFETLRSYVDTVAGNVGR
jgi:hypothetical protein